MFKISIKNILLHGGFLKTMELCLNFCILHYLISIIDYKKNQSLKLNFILTKWAAFKFHIQQFSHKCNMHFEIFQIKININRKANLSFIFFYQFVLLPLWNSLKFLQTDKNRQKCNKKFKVPNWNMVYFICISK